MSFIQKESNIMIGIGKWEASVSAMMMNMSGIVEIHDNGGKYEFIYEPPERFKNVQIKYHSIEEVGTDTLVVKGEASVLPGKIIEIHATFNDNKLTGYIKAPIMGGMKIKIKDGHRIG